jgi:hypothetical protein
MKSFLSVAVALVGLAIVASPARALTASCQADLDKFGLVRLEVINKINAFQKKRPTAQQACGVFGQLVKAEADMLKWMEDNQQWCQLPEPFIEDFRKNTQQGVKTRGQICTAAKKEAQARAQGGASPRGPAPGSGVQLPKGAL